MALHTVSSSDSMPSWMSLRNPQYQNCLYFSMSWQGNPLPATSILGIERNVHFKVRSQQGVKQKRGSIHAMSTKVDSDILNLSILDSNTYSYRVDLQSQWNGYSATLCSEKMIFKQKKERMDLTKQPILKLSQHHFHRKEWGECI